MARERRRRRAAFAPGLEAFEARVLLNADAPTGDLLVRFVEGAPRAAILRRLGATVVEDLPGAQERIAPRPGDDPAALAKALMATRKVVYAELASAPLRASSDFVPNDPLYPKQWGLSNPAGNGVDIGAPAAWAIATGTPSTIVAVLDSGVDVNHPDLASQLWTNPDAATDGLGDVNGWNFVANTANIQDDNGHGTAVAGILAATGNNAAGIVGVAPNVRIMAIKTIDAVGGGTVDAAVRGIYYAVAHGARIINASWDGGVYSQALADAIAYAGTQRVVVVVAAGNTSTDDDTSPNYPASYVLSNMISVAAVDRSGNLADFSNYGPNTVGIAAPGVDIASTYLNDGYATISGTSMATPFVSGTLALLASQHPEYSAEQLAWVVLNTASPLPSLAGKVASGGIVDAARALSATPTTPAAPSPASTSKPIPTPQPTVTATARPTPVVRARPIRRTPVRRAPVRRPPPVRHVKPAPIRRGR